MDGEKERQGDFVFTATEVGEYRFCFDNAVSTFSDKTVDFEITVSALTQYLSMCAIADISSQPLRSKTKPKPPSRRKPAPVPTNSAASKKPL